MAKSKFLIFKIYHYNFEILLWTRVLSHTEVSTSNKTYSHREHVVVQNHTILANMIPYKRTTHLIVRELGRM